MSAEEDWLTREDKECRTERLKRLEWITEKFHNNISFGLHYGGIKSKYLFDEVRYCFVYGQYIAVILLSMSYIETMLASYYYGSGDNEIPFSAFSKILNQAKEDGILTEDEYNIFDNIRNIRNPLTHFKRPLDEKSPEAIALKEQCHIYDILENDARKTIQAMFKLVRYFAV